MRKIDKKELDYLLAIIEQLCRAGGISAASCVDKTTFALGDIVCVQWCGVLTWQIQTRLRFKLSLTQTRYRLNKLWEEGELIKRSCAGGTTLWWPVGLAKKLQEEKGAK